MAGRQDPAACENKRSEKRDLDGREGGKEEVGSSTSQEGGETKTDDNTATASDSYLERGPPTNNSSGYSVTRSDCGYCGNCAAMVASNVKLIKIVDDLNGVIDSLHSEIDKLNNENRTLIRDVGNLSSTMENKLQPYSGLPFSGFRLHQKQLCEGPSKDLVDSKNEIEAKDNEIPQLKDKFNKKTKEETNILEMQDKKIKELEQQCDALRKGYLLSDQNTDFLKNVIRQTETKLQETRDITDRLYSEIDKLNREKGELLQDVLHLTSNMKKITNKNETDHNHLKQRLEELLQHSGWSLFGFGYKRSKDMDHKQIFEELFKHLEHSKNAIKAKDDEIAQLNDKFNKKTEQQTNILKEKDVKMKQLVQNYDALSREGCQLFDQNTVLKEKLSEKDKELNNFRLKCRLHVSTAELTKAQDKINDLILKIKDRDDAINYLRTESKGLYDALSKAKDDHTVLEKRLQNIAEEEKKMSEERRLFTQKLEKKLKSKDDVNNYLRAESTSLHNAFSQAKDDRTVLEKRLQKIAEEEKILSGERRLFTQKLEKMGQFMEAFKQPITIDQVRRDTKANFIKNSLDKIRQVDAKARQYEAKIRTFHGNLESEAYLNYKDILSRFIINELDTIESQGNRVIQNQQKEVIVYIQNLKKELEKKARETG